MRVSSPFTRKQHAKEDTRIRGGEREEKFSSSSSIHLPNFFKHRVSIIVAKIHDGSDRSSSVIIKLWASYSSANGISLGLSEAEPA